MEAWLWNRLSADNWLSSSADVLSIISFGISVWLAWTVKQIRRQFLFQARLPDLMKSLRDHTKRISEHLNQFEETQREIDAILAQARSIIKSVQIKVWGDTKSATKRLITAIDRRDRPVSKDQTWTIYTDLQGLIESLDHLERDSRWR